MSPERVRFLTLSGVWREACWLSGREGGQPCPSPGTPGPSESFLWWELGGHQALVIWGPERGVCDAESGSVSPVWSAWNSCWMGGGGEVGVGYRGQWRLLVPQVMSWLSIGDRNGDSECPLSDIPGWTLLSAFLGFHLNESLNSSWHRRCTINWRWANWGSGRSSLAHDHTARKWWNWVEIGPKASPVSHKMLNPWAYVMEKNKRPDSPWRPGLSLPCFCSGSPPSAQLWHLLGVSAHSAFEFGAWRILLAVQNMLK